MKVVCISDVTMGYGSPQIVQLLRSLREIRADAELIVVEPNEKPARHAQYPDLRIIRHETKIHPYEGGGREEYLALAARTLLAEDPDVVVVSCYWSLPALADVPLKRGRLIYYQLEPLVPGLAEAGDYDLQRVMAERFDLMLFPEEGRRRDYMQSFGQMAVRSEVIYNVKPRAPFALDLHRQPKILYQGNIRLGMTYPEYFFSADLRGFTVDFFGSLDPSSRKLFEIFREQVNYRGLVPSAELDRIRGEYAFSFVAWNPQRRDHFLACPNKFFESISSGVPPITAPHPQCKLVLEKYGCGILMKDWSVEAFEDAFSDAARLFREPAKYREMVDNCRRASDEELNWELQVGKIGQDLETIMKGGRPSPKANAPF